MSSYSPKIREEQQKPSRVKRTVNAHTAADATEAHPYQPNHSQNVARIIHLQKTAGNQAAMRRIHGTDERSLDGKEQGGAVQRLSLSWRKRPNNMPVTATDTGYLDNKDAEQRKKQANKVAGSVESKTPDYLNEALNGQTPDRFVITIAVAQDQPDWLKDVKHLRREVRKVVTTSPVKSYKAGKAGGFQDLVVGRVLQKDNNNWWDFDEGAQEEAITKFTDGIHEVGHTWVRLTSYVGNEVKEHFSFGFWPQKLYSAEGRAEEQDEVGGYDGFVKGSPGQVKHPDVAHEADANKAYLDYPLSEKAYERALDYAAEMYDNPPVYQLTGYNCTAFVRDVVRKAGKSFPGRGILPGWAYTPGALLKAVNAQIAKNKPGAHNDEDHPDIINQVSDETAERAETGKLSELAKNLRYILQTEFPPEKPITHMLQLKFEHKLPGFGIDISKWQNADPATLDAIATKLKIETRRFALLISYDMSKLG